MRAPLLFSPFLVLAVLGGTALVGIRATDDPATFGGEDFSPPDLETRRAAVGDISDLSELERRAFDATRFAPIPTPGPGDWLANHTESGQTFADWRDGDRNVPDATRNVICLQPISAFDPDRSPSLEALERLTEAFYGMEVRVLPVRSTDGAALTTRVNSGTGKQQILTGDVLRWLAKDIPDDAYCVLAITMTDLYPDPEWNFVFGSASLKKRVGVYSFARYDPAFFGSKREDDYLETVLRRSLKVLVHETTHMFGVEHCVYFSCIVNGSNNLAESDSRSVHLCAMCLRKLHTAIGFELVPRYEELAAAYAEVGLEAESTWAKDRAEFVRD